MNAAEIAALREAFKRGTIYWRPYESAPALKIVSFGTDPKPESNVYVPEPGLLAFLAAPTGGFVALHNAELCDFIVANRIEVHH